MGYSSLNSFFTIAPLVFLFLVPAITMKMFAEEKKIGTLDLILAKPISDLEIVLAKFFASLMLVFASLLPTLIYYITIYFISFPIGNIDTGGIIGSYIGLFFLASAYISISLFSSVITDNQILAFLGGAFLCFFFYFAFDTVAELPFLKPISFYVYKLGINEHYKSLSRGVIDSRDIIYFISFDAFFLLITKLKLTSRKWN